jgi:hypothetical protein
MVTAFALVGATAAMPAIAQAHTTDTQPPSAPAGFTATPGNGQVVLHWTPSTDNVKVAGYVVWRRDDPGSDWSQMGRTQATSYVDTSVSPGSGYAYGVRAYDAAGNVSASSAIVPAMVAGAGTGTPADDMGATGYRQLVQQPFSPTSTVTAANPAQFAYDVANLQAGEELDVQPMTLSGEYFITNKNLTSYAEIHFAPGVVFSGAKDFKYYTLQLSNDSNIRLYGGEVDNPTNGACVRIDSSVNVLWWHFYFHNCASTGMQVGSISRAETGIDLDGTIDHVAYDPTDFDPHAEKCTGIHGAYLGGDSSLDFSAKISIYVHDAECGAAMEVGTNTMNSELWLKAEHVPYEAKYQAAGNAIQFWGSGLNSITVHDVVGADLAGRVVNTGGVYTGGMSNVVVQYARATDTLQNPLLSRVNYETDVSGISYEDVAPLP